ncbi:uncharacterized protein V1518DRAFT_299528 [Limtongia smithiae]|uniref:uncharacterized protein n=1 Tax=Limtongia smithiae TaxID=1125753 RepID=UPI0034CD04EE
MANPSRYTPSHTSKDKSAGAVADSDDDFDDDYFVELLIKEAHTKQANYSTQGVSAYLTKRQNTSGLQPNVNFLSRMVKNVDSHNSALIRKEAERAAAKSLTFGRLGRPSEAVSRQSSLSKNAERGSEYGRLSRSRSPSPRRHDETTERRPRTDARSSSRHRHREHKHESADTRDLSRRRREDKDSGHRHSHHDRRDHNRDRDRHDRHDHHDREDHTVHDESRR